MRKLILFILFIGFGKFITAQTILFSENFEGSTSNFILNSTDVNSIAVGENYWTINNDYIGGSATTLCLGFPVTFSVPNTSAQPGTYLNNPYSNYLHMISVASFTNGINNCCFLAADGICANPENNFAKMDTDINTSGFSNVTLNFGWLCMGSPNNYGEVYYSVDGGASWVQLSLPLPKYYNTGNWTSQSITNAAFDNVSTLRFGFRFVNGVTTSAFDPGFGIDEISISGTQNFVMPNANFVASAVALCEKSTVDFTNLSTNATSYLWLFPGGVPSSSTDTNPSAIYYANYGSYNVTLIATNANGTDTAEYINYITVNQNPPAPTVTPSGNFLISSVANSYQWFLNNLPIPGGTNQVQTITQPGSYYVIITDSNGCQAASNLVVISAVSEYQGSAGFYLLNESDRSIAILNRGNLTGPLDVVISTVQGRMVCQHHFGRITPAVIDIASLTSGFYLASIINNSSKTILKFVIK